MSTMSSTYTQDLSSQRSLDSHKTVVRAGLYERMSSGKQRFSIERQDGENRSAVETNGWTAVRYTDAALSASRFAGKKGGDNRPGFVAMLADIRAGQLDVVVLHDTSRGSRELVNWAGLLSACRASRTLIHVTAHGKTYDLANPREWKSLAEDGIDNEYDAEKRRALIMSGKARARAAGRPQGSPPYGVRRVYDPQSRAWIRDEADPQTAPIAAEIITRAAAGESYEVIAQDLNRRGISSPSGQTWPGQSVTRIAGMTVYTELGIVDEAVSLAARARKADKSRKGERPNMAVYRYSLVMNCAVCGSPVRGVRRGGRSYYRCNGGCAYVDMASADLFIDAVAIERLSRPDALAEFETADDSAVIAAENEAASLRQRISDATKSYTAGRVGIDVVESVSAELGPRIQAAEKRARELRTPSALAGLADDDRVLVKIAWDGLSLAQRKAAIRALMPSLELRRPARPHMRADVGIAERVIPWPE